MATLHDDIVLENWLAMELCLLYVSCVEEKNLRVPTIRFNCFGAALKAFSLANQKAKLSGAAIA